MGSRVLLLQCVGHCGLERSFIVNQRSYAPYHRPVVIWETVLDEFL